LLDVEYAHPVAKQTFYLDRADQLRYTIKDVLVGQYASSGSLDFRVRGAAARGLMHLVADEGECLGVVKPPAFGEAATGKFGGREDRETVELDRE